MAYDPEKDRKIYEHPEIEGARGSKILIGIHIYNGSEPKLRLNRAKTLADGEVKIGKLGGITAQEARSVGVALLGIGEDPGRWEP